MLRTTRGLTLRQVQEGSGVPNATFCQIETGRIKSPRPDLLVKLATFFQVDYQMLWRKAGYVVPLDAVPHVHLTEGDHRVLEAIAGLPEGKKYRVADVVAMLRAVHRRRLPQSKPS